jgi:integrase
MGERYNPKVVKDAERRYRLGVTMADGTRRWVRGTTPSAVREKARVLQGHAAAGTKPTPALARVGPVTENWRTNVLPHRKLAPATIEQYDTYARFITARVGQRRLGDFTAGQIQAWLVSLAEEDYARSTIRIIRHVLKAVFAWALKDGLVAHNYAADTELGTIGRDPAERDPYTPAEIRALLGAIAEDRLEALWLLMLTTGCRRVEACGVRWEDVNFKAQTVHFPISKTAGGVRTVPLSPTAAAALERHAQAQRSARMAAKSWADTELVFTNGVGQPLDRSRYQRAWRALIKRADVEGVAHEMRKTVGSYAIDADQPVADVAAQLGITVETLLRYYYRRTRPVAPGPAAVVEALITQAGT